MKVQVLASDLGNLKPDFYVIAIRYLRVSNCLYSLNISEIDITLR